jgi:hypothetical protein
MLGISRNYTEFCYTEFRIIPRTFRLFRTAYGMYEVKKATKFRIDGIPNHPYQDLNQT